MPTLPLIFDTIPEVEATKLRAACLYPFLHHRERFGTFAVVVAFSPFWAGKFRRHAENACAIVRHCMYAPPREYKTKKNTNARGPKMKNGRETKSREGDEILGGKMEFFPVRDVTGRIAMEIVMRRTRVTRERPSGKKIYQIVRVVERGSDEQREIHRGHGRMHPTGTNVRQSIVSYSSSSHGASPTIAKGNVAERDGASIRALTGPRRKRNREGERCGRS